jgi:hypothetical protein
MTLLYIPNLFFFTLLQGRIPFLLDQLPLIYQDKENLQQMTFLLNLLMESI